MTLDTDSSHSDTPLLDTLEVAEKSRFESDLDVFLRENDAKKALKIWFSRLSCLPTLKHVPDPQALLGLDIADLDDLINEQLKVILHHPKLLQLEAAWRGIDLLTKIADESTRVKVKLLDITWKEVTRDIERSLEFDQSNLFQKIYSDEFGTPGGEPYGVIICNYEVQHRPSSGHPFDDMSTLHTLAQIAAAAFSPFILGASPAFFGVNKHEELNATLNYEQIFKQHEYIKWRAYRDTEDSRFLALALPRILMREPRRHELSTFEGISLKPDTDTHLWGNAAFALGIILIREFNNVGWFSHIRGTPRDNIGGGLVVDLPIVSFKTDRPEVALKPITNTIITDELEKVLGDQGFIPLCQCYDTPFAAFHSNYSTQKPKLLDSAAANINARLSAMLQHILCASRFAHYIKVMIRDKVGSFFSAQDCESFLQRWLTDYITGTDGLDWDMQAKYPLRDAKVTVIERPDKPGFYNSIIHLKPHYQLDQMVSELKLTTELAAVASRR